MEFHKLPQGVLFDIFERLDVNGIFSLAEGSRGVVEIEEAIEAYMQHRHEARRCENQQWSISIQYDEWRIREPRSPILLGGCKMWRMRHSAFDRTALLDVDDDDDDDSVVVYAPAYTAFDSSRLQLLIEFAIRFGHCEILQIYIHPGAHPELSGTVVDAVVDGCQQMPTIRVQLFHCEYTLPN